MNNNLTYNQYNQDNQDNHVNHVNHVNQDNQIIYNKRENKIPTNGYYFTYPTQYGGKISKQERDRKKASQILNEMVETHQNKNKNRNNIENSTSRYLLLFSVDMDFRKDICGLIGKLYKMKVTPDRVNEKTIRHLVTYHKPVIDNVYKVYCKHNEI